MYFRYAISKLFWGLFQISSDQSVKPRMNALNYCTAVTSTILAGQLNQAQHMNLLAVSVIRSQAWFKTKQILGGFKDFIFSPPFGEAFQFDYCNIFQMG